MNTKNNILISSVGRRVSLLKFFRNETALLNLGKVYCSDSSPELSSACQIDAALSIKSLKITDNLYKDFLIETVEKYNIGMIIPTIDTELPILSQISKQLNDRGCIAIVSENSFIEKCADKFKCANFFTEFGIKTPKILNPQELTFPCFVRPRYGSLSTNAFAIPSRKHLSQAILENKDNIFTEFLSIKEYDEYTIDMYYNKNGKLCNSVPRKRLEIRGGEISKGITVKSDIIFNVLKKLAYIPGVVGVITAQFFLHKKNQDIYGIEINPRFGGGYPLSFHAGANFPRMLLEEYYLGIDHSYSNDWQENTMFLRYDSEVVIHNSDDRSYTL